MKKLKRIRLEGRIEALARKDSLKAEELAVRGRNLSELEGAIWAYLHLLDGRYQKLYPSKALLQRATEAKASELCGHFLRAVRGCDVSALRSIANEVESFSADKPEANLLRAHILAVKNMLVPRGATWTRTQLLRHLQGFKKLAGIRRIDDPADGAWLWKLARKLDFPFRRKRGRNTGPNKPASRA